MRRGVAATIQEVFILLGRGMGNCRSGGLNGTECTMEHKRGASIEDLGRSVPGRG